MIIKTADRVFWTKKMMDIEMTLALFHDAKLTQVETVNLLALALQSDEMDLQYGLSLLDESIIPVSREIKIILRKLGIVQRKLVKLDAKKVVESQGCSITEQTMSRFLDKNASQQETLAILIGATQDSTVKSFVLNANKSGNLDKNTTILFKKLGVLPVINAWTSWNLNGFH